MSEKMVMKLGVSDAGGAWEEKLINPVWIHLMRRGLVVLLPNYPEGRSDPPGHYEQRAEIRFWNWRQVHWWRMPAELVYRVVDDQDTELSALVDNPGLPRPIPTAAVSSDIQGDIDLVKTIRDMTKG